MSGYTLTRPRHQSRVLEDNPLGDPTDRTVPVLLPPGYEEKGDRTWPVLFVLAGFLGSGHSFLNWDLFGETLTERLDRLHEEGGMPPCLVVLPDCSTRLGGSQYRNSPAVGRYADYITEELVPWVDAEYRVAPGRRGVLGKSSGGYGSLMLSMDRPGLFRAAASHSGDCYFEYCYKRDFPDAVNRLTQAGGVEAFLEEFHAAKKKPSRDIHTLNVVAMAACYSPDPEGPCGIGLPFRLPTGELRAQVWERWLENDPAFRVEEDPAARSALADLELLFLDCGSRDEWALHLGMRILSERLKAHGVDHVTEEFEDGHRHISYRLDASLPRMARVLSEEG